MTVCLSRKFEVSINSPGVFSVGVLISPVDTAAQPSPGQANLIRVTPRLPKLNLMPHHTRLWLSRICWTNCSARAPSCAGRPSKVNFEILPYFTVAVFRYFIWSLLSLARHPLLKIPCPLYIWSLFTVLAIFNVHVGQIVKCYYLHPIRKDPLALLITQKIRGAADLQGALSNISIVGQSTLLLSNPGRPYQAMTHEEIIIMILYWASNHHEYFSINIKLCPSHPISLSPSHDPIPSQYAIKSPL